jgi:Kef-type K+ transport system membrane component KefB
MPFPWMTSAAEEDPEVIPVVLLALALVLVGAKLTGEIVERLGQPAVLGELLFGIALTNLPLLQESAISGLPQNETFATLAELGAILVLFQVGLESTPREMMAVRGVPRWSAGVDRPSHAPTYGGRSFLPQLVTSTNS